MPGASVGLRKRCINHEWKRITPVFKYFLPVLNESYVSLLLEESRLSFSTSMNHLLSNHHTSYCCESRIWSAVLYLAQCNLLIYELAFNWALPWAGAQRILSLCTGILVAIRRRVFLVGFPPRPNAMLPTLWCIEMVPTCLKYRPYPKRAARQSLKAF